MVKINYRQLIDINAAVSFIKLKMKDVPFSMLNLVIRNEPILGEKLVEFYELVNERLPEDEFYVKDEEGKVVIKANGKVVKKEKIEEAKAITDELFAFTTEIEFKKFPAPEIDFIIPSEHRNGFNLIVEFLIK